MTKKIDVETVGQVGLKLIADNLVAPLGVLFPDDGSDRLFIIDEPGIIKLINKDGSLQKVPFLDITQKVVKFNTNYDERGLLGLAFHPNFKQNGKFYIYYNIPLRNGAPKGWDSTIRLSEFTVSKDNFNIADPNSEKVLLEFDKPYYNHNGGQIIFGPDGYLYVSVGDGGNANDVGKGHNEKIGNGQDTFTFLGKILRIDINKTPYAIPSDNPFADGKKGLKEIFAYGLRNAWRMSFDGNDLYAGDVGQNLWEEIYIIKKGGNYGWNIKEGTHCFNPKNADKSPEKCSAVGYMGEPLLDPIIEYKNATNGGIGHANVGGYLYRGKAISSLYGKFIFGDWSTGLGAGDGTLFVADPSKNGMWKFGELKISGTNNGRLGEFLLSFGRDQNGELYIATTKNSGPKGNTGKIYKLIPVDTKL